MSYRILLVILTLALLRPSAPQAHEFWIEPTAHVVTAGDTVEANLKVGQDYSGTIFPYLPSRFVSFLQTGPAGRKEVTGTVGDTPALRIPDIAAGLHIFTYSSTADTLQFRDWALFRKYVAYEGNGWAIAAHQQAGLPETGFSESYTRHAKALVQAGPTSDQDTDRPTGMALELVALSSPYRLAPGQSELPVQLLWQGAPLAGQQINIFHKSGPVTLRSVETDQDGRAMVPVADTGRYLLNAVHMVLNGADAAHVWESSWASLTFEITAPP